MASAPLPAPISGTITVSGPIVPTGSDPFTVSITVRGLTPPAAGQTLSVAVTAGCDELIVYTCETVETGYSKLADADECLYLFGAATASLPALGANMGYIAVDLTGARGHKGFVHTRGLIEAYVGKMKNAGPQPGGTGPVKSYP